MPRYRIDIDVEHESSMCFLLRALADLHDCASANATITTDWGSAALRHVEHPLPAPEPPQPHPYDLNLPF
jgi:hypothetical protein